MIRRAYVETQQRVAEGYFGGVGRKEKEVGENLD